MDNISLVGPPGDSTTFTARKGSLQLSVINDNTYPVRLALTVRSKNLTLDQTRIVDVFPPGNRTITIEATARTSGRFLSKSASRPPTASL